ncbi:MAG: FxsA family protein [Sandaracinaceae bacterium]
MLARLFLLFTVVPFIELFLLMQVGDLVGFWPTVLMILTTGLVGAWLAKREGLRVWSEYQKALSELRMPDEGLTSALLVLVGGALMIAPGVLTDVTGILLMIPPIRRVVARAVEAYVKKHFFGGAPGSRGSVVFHSVHVGPNGVVRQTVRRSVVEATGDLSARKPKDDEVLEPDAIVDRRGRVVARLED